MASDRGHIISAELWTFSDHQVLATLKMILAVFTREDEILQPAEMLSSEPTSLTGARRLAFQRPSMLSTGTSGQSIEVTGGNDSVLLRIVCGIAQVFHVRSFGFKRSKRLQIGSHFQKSTVASITDTDLLHKQVSLNEFIDSRE